MGSSVDIKYLLVRNSMCINKTERKNIDCRHAQLDLFWNHTKEKEIARACAK